VSSSPPGGAQKRTKNPESARQVLASTVELTAENQETTVYRFKLDENGDLASDSVNSLPKSLRKWRY
jgi:hypothetical protein